MAEVPDVYADQFTLALTSWGGASLAFSSSPGQLTPEILERAKEGLPLDLELRAIIRMPIAHAKAMAMLLRQQLKAYEKANGQIVIQKDTLKQLGLTNAAW